MASPQRIDGAAHGNLVNILPIGAYNEPSVRSANSNTQTNIAFVNFRANPVHIWWRSFDAQRVSYGVVAANGGRQDMRTYLTHPWVVTDEESGEALGVWMPIPEGGLVVVT
ncbi:hypothetical protein FIBSPDRAFT_1045391 [Athelia psychrophila]|uniref:von Hippel-Lindau disease tumour suppressor beta domain-containing protein n=1 Tax=Athelia psychrophila TaxID=1759441 RepID=A0A166IA22_9AGAM|nr:hypothetical protein FIBSPDRAFT_1045391 [Fibularhizoctonia sp. CBS 109695]